MKLSTYIIRRTSSVLRSTKSKDILRAVVKAAGKADISEAHEDETLAMYPILREVLPSYGELGPYQRVRQVHAIRRFEIDPAARSPFLDACVRLGSDRTRMYVRSRGVERSSDGEPDLHVTIGWDTLIQSAGPLGVATAAPMCRIEINESSPGYPDRAYRRDLFARALEAMGCPNALKLDLVDGALTVTAAEGWRALLDRADFGDRNPCAITLFGFDDIRAAVEAGEKAAGRLFQRIYRSALIVATSDEEVYETLRPSLNELADRWEVTVVGSLTEAAATVLAGRVPVGVAPPRLPVFEWVKEGLHQDQVLLGELVAVDGGYALELASQTLPPERLNACIKAVESRPAKKA